MTPSEAALIALLISSSGAQSKIVLPVKTVAAVVKQASDGDTVNVCRKGLDIFEVCVPIRIRGINTPEKHICKTSDTSQCETCQAGVDLGIAATNRARELLKPGDKVILSLYYRDLHGRIVADVKMTNGTDFASQMILEKLAATYDFEANQTRPRPWCP